MVSLVMIVSGYRLGFEQDIRHLQIAAVLHHLRSHLRRDADSLLLHTLHVLVALQHVVCHHARLT